MTEIIDSDKPTFSELYFLERAIKEAEFIMERIDKLWATGVASEREW